MPSYKLSYFDARGRGEVARQLFYLAGVPFEDHRIKKDDWPDLKTSMVFGQLPVLDVDGKQLPQSFAIFRYLAKEFGFAGDSPFEAAWVDALADQWNDYFTEIFPALAVIIGLRDGSRFNITNDKDQLLRDIVIPARDKFFTLLEKQAKDNGRNGHFVGSSLTWVDLLIADHVTNVLKSLPNFLDGFPTVLETISKIESTPNLKEWIEKRADTSY